MIKTYKIKHGKDLTRELGLARKVAEFAIANRDRLSTKYVKHIGLTATITNQILRKYGRNKNCRTVKNVKLMVKGCNCIVREDILHIGSLGLDLDIGHLPKFTKLNQVEIGETYAYIPVTVLENKEYKPKGSLGIDRNTTKHCVVAADTKTGKVMMLGKSAQHIRQKYNNIRRRLQKAGEFKEFKKIKTRESDKIRDLNHKMSRKLVDYARENRLAIKLEDLKGVRKTPKQRKSFRYSLNSWSYYQLQTFLEYKAKELGVPIAYVAPQYTSKLCSRCGLLGTRLDKVFKCPAGHVAHADINAAFNIGQRGVGDSWQKKMPRSGSPITVEATL